MFRAAPADRLSCQANRGGEEERAAPPRDVQRSDMPAQRRNSLIPCGTIGLGQALGDNVLPLELDQIRQVLERLRVPGKKRNGQSWIVVPFFSEVFAQRGIIVDPILDATAAINAYKDPN